MPDASHFISDFHNIGKLAGCNESRHSNLEGDIMKMFRWFTAVIVVVIGAWGAGLAQEAEGVHTDYDKKVNFSQFKTYAWGKVQTSNPLWQDRIRDAVDKDMQAKGLQRVEANGDVTLTAVGGTHNEKEYQTFYDGFGPGWRWRHFGDESITTVQTYKIGTLVLDIYDNNKQLVWRGTASQAISDDPNKNEKKLQKSVDKMFDKFPPERKEKD